MGEKGNITSEELLNLSGAAAAGGSATSSATAVVEEVGATFRDKVVDKGVDATIETTVTTFTRADPEAPSENGPGSAGT